jgi:hypothetical protein
MATDEVNYNGDVYGNGQRALHVQIAPPLSARACSVPFGLGHCPMRVRFVSVWVMPRAHCCCTGIWTTLDIAVIG